MTHSMKVSFAVLASALFALSWFGGATAQLDESDYYDAFRDQSGAIPNFPFRICNANAGAYRLAPVYRYMGGRKYCFTIEVPTACSGPCCQTNLHKLEFNVSGSCLVPGTSVNATVNGVRTTVGPALDTPPYSNPGAGVLRITQLLLDKTTARNAELCITLNPNRGGMGCTTLEQLCATPGTPPGTCSAAIFDSTCDCCPISSAIMARPPPPPSPPPPSPPLAPITPICDLSVPVCVTATLEPPPYDPNPFRYDAAACVAIQQEIINSIAAVKPADVNVTFSPSVCMETTVSVCGSFQSYNIAKNFTETVMKSQMSGWLDIASNDDICQPELQGYEVAITVGDRARRLRLFESTSCTLPKETDCTCTPGP